MGSIVREVPGVVRVRRVFGEEPSIWAVESFGGVEMWPASSQ